MVKLTIYLKDLDDFQAMNEIYGEFLSSVHPPARTTIQAAKLPLDAKIEMDGIAIVQ